MNIPQSFFVELMGACLLFAIVAQSLIGIIHSRNAILKDGIAEKDWLKSFSQEIFKIIRNARRWNMNQSSSFEHSGR
jgi:hypothetical protein